MTTLLDEPLAPERAAALDERDARSREIVAALTRRQFVLGGLAVGAAIVIPGCGSDEGDSGAGTSGGAGFPRTVAHSLGTTRIDAPPRRVVALEPDVALALGVVPVAMGEWSGIPGIAPWARAPLGSHRPPVIDAMGTLDVERIASLRPDLILHTWANQQMREDYERLSQIAPTVAGGPKGWLEPWQAQLDLAARALGRERQAERARARTTGHLAALRRDHPRLAWASITFAGLLGGSLFVLGSAAPGMQGLIGLGLERSGRVADDPSGWTPLSYERLDLLDADVLVVSYPGDADRRRVEAMPLFAAVPAVRRDHYVACDMTVARALVNGTVLGLPWALDQLVPRIDRALA